MFGTNWQKKRISPRFTKFNLDLIKCYTQGMDLIKQQEELQKEGYQILQELKLVEILSPFGEVDIGGSLKTGLMVWRDIDIGVLSIPSEDEIWKIARIILDKPYVNSITIINNIKKQNPIHPNGWYLGIKYGKEGVVWKIDLWFVNKKGDRAFEKWLLSKINDDNKRIILQIKSQVWESPKYKKTIFSTDIYKAVIENGVRDLEGFKKYLQYQKKSLD